MKLWLLELPDSYGTHYGVNYGFVIRAETEERARALASAEGADEGKAIWLDPKRSSCVELTADGAEEVVLNDFNAG